MSLQRKSSYRSRWDAFGISASVLCAIHCVILPFFISTLPFLGIELMKNTLVESAMILASLLLGSWALYTGFRKHHGKRWPLMLFSAGMMFLLSTVLWFPFGGAEIALKALAAACIIIAHLFNWKYSRNCGV